MKGAARLTLFYIVTFAFFLGASAAFSLVRAWALAVSAVPPRSFSAIAIGLSSFVIVLPLAAYGAVLATFTYASRHGIGNFLSAFLIFALTTVVLVAFAYGGRRLDSYGAAEAERSRILAPGVNPNSIMVTRFENGGAVALAGGVAVVAAPDAPLRVADVGEGPEYGQRSIRVDPFAPSLAVPPSLADLAAVFSATGSRLNTAAGAGVLPLLAYAAALSCLLASFRFLAGITRWPFADFVLCAVALRGVAAYDDFLASATVGRLLKALAGHFPAEYLVPAALTAAGLAVALCSLLSSAAGGRRRGDV